MKKSDLFNVNFVYFILIVLFVGVRIASSAGAFSFLGESGSYIISAGIQIVLMFMLPLVLITLLRKNSFKQTFSDCGFRKITWSQFFIAVGIGIIIFVLNIFLSSIVSYILYLFGYNPTTVSSVGVEATWGNFALSMLTVAILPAICEEFTHRGMLLSGYKTLGLKRAVIYSALLFGLLHLNIEQFIFAFLVGLILALVTYFTKSILPAIIIHFINNGISTYLDFARIKNLPYGNLLENIGTFFSGNFLVSAIFFIMAIPLLILLLTYLISQLLKINANQSLKKAVSDNALQELRRETLGEIAGEPAPTEPIIFSKEWDPQAKKHTMKIKIPYELLGFSVLPQSKPSLFDNVFFYSSVFLGAVVTIFTFIWGVI